MGEVVWEESVGAHWWGDLSQLGDRGGGGGLAYRNVLRARPELTRIPKSSWVARPS